ncbi:MAG: UPF0323 family lipoprotein [Sulfurospirillum sp.]|nr:UPF0323 family lipoprotein [Sulfurospirillum sp.]
MKYVRKISDYIVAGGIGAMVIAGMQGCEKNNEQNALTQATQPQGAFVVIEQMENGGYTIVEEYPSATTRVVVRELDGNERMLSKDEMDRLVAQEAVKIDNGTSSLTEPSMSSSAPGLGAILLSSVAGAMLGSYIGNKLFNNQNFQNQKRTNYKTPQAYSRSNDSFKKAKSGTSKSNTKKSSGFFGNKKTTRSRSSFGG